MEKLTAAQIFKATKPFFVVRALVCTVITLIMLGAAILLGWLAIKFALDENIAGLFIVIIIMCGGFWGGLRFVERYILYMLKAAHISAITEYIKTREVPVTEKGYKGVMAYGAEMVKKNFVTTNVAFAADVLIAGATKQIMKWVNKVGKLITWIPGGDKIMAFIELVLSTALNYIDEAVLSYIFYKKDEEGNAFKKACDGLVYYAQSWKSMLKGALKVGAFVWAVHAVSMIIFTAVAYGVISAASGGNVGVAGLIIGLIIAFTLRYGIEHIIVDPYATCIMINDYYKAIDGKPLSRDLHGTLCKVSGKFKNLFKKSEQPEPEVPAETMASLGL
ncbi:MAG: hypothetical protein FWE60_02770 [Oscillospiraceae bacterium]|nr:hypothetical protein [Oscillospiraceae bacterium]